MNARRPRFVTTDDRELSLWQSAVAFHVRRKLAAAGQPHHAAAVLAHPMMAAVHEHVLAEKKGSAPSKAARASQAAFHRAFPARAPEDAGSGRSPADSDIGEWLEVFVENSALLAHKDKPQYIDCEGNMCFGVIDWTLPDDATLVVLGDWGSGNDDAIALLQDAIAQAGPKLSAVIHLGDVYYSGQPSECQANIVSATAQAFAQAGVAQVPMFWVPGNHEYYSMGQGYYLTYDTMNAGIPGAQQAASFFCLRTAGGAFQLLGMDTGQSDYVAAKGPFGAASPALRASEAAWHQDKLQGFGGATILLSHHQLFSACAAVTDGSDTPWVNTALWQVFQPYFQDVALWLWGHEHDQQLFYPGMFGLAKGRLLGASAYEEATDDDDLTPQYPLVQLTGAPGLTAADGYYDHGYAIIDLGAATISYYAFPSWAPGDAPASPQGTLLATEALATPAQMGAAAWPPAANLLRYVPLGMAPGHLNRVSVSSTGARGSWTTLADDVQVTQAVSASVLSFSGSSGSDWSLSVQIAQPTSGSAATCNLAVSLRTSSGILVNIDSPAAAVTETTAADGSGGLASGFSLSAGGSTVTVSSFPYDEPDVAWYAHVLFVITCPGQVPVYLAIEDKSLPDQ
ncbi:MAG: metallophosphoesterase [Minicystis sp.]